MPGTIEQPCANSDCDETARIASQSVGFIASATGWDREDCIMCDACLSEAMGGVTLDLSIGAGHTGSDEFEQQRQQRKRDRAADKIAAVQESSIVRFEDRFVDDDSGRERVAIDGPSKMKHDLKLLKSSLHDPTYHHDRQTWSVIAQHVDDAIEHLRDQGWHVDVQIERP